MATALDWPAAIEGMDSPTHDELETERRYWANMDTLAEHDAWVDVQAQLESFETWPLEDLLVELETVRVLTPDQEDIIAELETAIAARQASRCRDSSIQPHTVSEDIPRTSADNLKRAG
ncbi:MAG: hypothetical protein ACR2JC_11260 [Chloroflexota bacterium]|nr:MAG: hypothetical protein DLM70_00790 [Chloroflexota bacterium]